MGFEPTTTCLEGRSSTAELHPQHSNAETKTQTSQAILFRVPTFRIWDGRRGIRTPELRRGQIYSLVQLTTLPSAHVICPRFSQASPQSHRWGSNPRPTVYKTVALPLCYDGTFRESFNIGARSTPTRFDRKSCRKMFLTLLITQVGEQKNALGSRRQGTSCSNCR